MAGADQWNYQATIQRLNESLIARGFATWFDLTRMKGSTMDAMSDAIEGADVMLYGVSLQYKESANVRRQAKQLFIWCVSDTVCSPCVCMRAYSADWRLTTPISKNWT